MDNSITSTNPVDYIKIVAPGGNEVLRIGPCGSVHWRGREIESDDDFKAAMRDASKVLCALYGIGETGAW